MQRLVPVEVPWMISPSANDLCLRVDEEGLARISLSGWFKYGTSKLEGTNAEIQPGTYAEVVVEIRVAFYSCLSAAARQDTVIDHALYDTSSISPEENETVFELMDRNEAVWQRTLVCPDPSFYLVSESERVRASSALRRLNVSHWILVGHDAYIEVVGGKMRWYLPNMPL